MNSQENKNHTENIEYWRIADKIISEIHKLSNNTASIDLKLHNRYTESDLEEVQNKIQAYLNNADEKCRQLKLDQAEHPNKGEYEKISKLCDQITRLLNERDMEELSDRDKGKCKNYFRSLFTHYSNLTYSFQTASRETKNIEDASPANNIGMILLCKNVRIMEDLINKICSNNIDKSIIGGDKHFDSMRYGFEWLFCHNDISRSESYKRIDIRDRNRYLDYIKYQIMVASKYVENSPKSSTDIDWYYLQIKDAFDKEKFEEKAKRIQAFKGEVTELIEDFFSVYELLIKYRDMLFYEEEIRKELGRDDETGRYISDNIINLSSVAVRVLLDRFVSFVKINDLNFGNSTFNRSWFNYSELSNSNYAGSNFKNARIENAKVKNCDLSTCNLSLADAGYTDFSYSNFNYSNLSGMNLIEATANYCEFQNAIFRDANIDTYIEAVNDSWGNDKVYHERAGKLIDIWSSTCYGAHLWEKIISAYKDIEPLDLTVSEENIPLDILKFELPKNVLKILTATMRDIIKLFLEKHISAELLNLVTERFSWQDPDARVNTYGKVLLEVANLTGISAKYAQLSGSDLCHITMHNASFENADLSASIMHYTKAQYASFMFGNMNQIECFESDYYSSNFSSAVMNNSLFLNCDLSHTNWNKAILIGSVFADLSNYVESTINERNADKVDLRIDECFVFDHSACGQRVISDCAKYSYHISENENHDFWQTDCNINDATFIDVLADNVVFLNISADRSSFNNASFRNAFLANCRMYLSDFIRSDFRYANIVLCCMGQSNFKNANMINAILRYVDFSNSNMSEALMNQSQLDHVLFENTDLRSLNFSGATIRNSAFINCKIQKMNTSGTRFINCIFSKIDFAQLVGSHSVKCEGCYLDNCKFDGKDFDDGEFDGKLDAEEFGR